MKVKIISEYGRGVDTEVVRFHQDGPYLIVEYEDGSEERYQHGKAVAAACGGKSFTDPEIEIGR